MQVSRSFRSIIVLCCLSVSVTSAATGGALTSLAPRKPSDIQTVQSSSFLSATCFEGSFQFDRLVTPPTVSPFEIPSGKVFVVNSIDWSVRGSIADQLVEIDFFVQKAGGVNGPSGQSVGLADSLGHAGGTVVFPTGIVVHADEILCAWGNNTGPIQLTAVAHGFLAADR